MICETLEGEKVIGYTENCDLYSHDFDISTNESAEKSKIKLFNFQHGPKQFATVLTPTGSVAVTEIESKELQKTRTIFNLLKYKSTRCFTICQCIIYFGIFFMKQGLFLQLNSKITDLRLCLLLEGGIMIGSSLLFLVLALKLGRQGCMAFGQGVTVVCLIAYVAVKYPPDCDMCLEYFIQIGLIQTSMIGINMALFNVIFQTCENIPTVLRIILLGLAFCMTNLANIFSYLFWHFIAQFGKDVMIYYISFMGTFSLASCSLKDHSEEVLRDFLDEQKQELQNVQELSIVIKEEINKSLAMSKRKALSASRAIDFNPEEIQQLQGVSISSEPNQIQNEESKNIQINGIVDDTDRQIKSEITSTLEAQKEQKQNALLKQKPKNFDQLNEEKSDH